MEKQPFDNETVKMQKIRDQVVSVDPTAQKKKALTIQMTDGGVLIPRKDDGHVLNSWRITFFSAILLLAGLVMFKPPQPYRDIFMVTIKGTPVTFQATVFAILGALVIGTVTGLGSVSKRRWVNMLSGVYVELIRGGIPPLLVQLIFIYYAMGRFFKIQGGMVAAVVALSICFGATWEKLYVQVSRLFPKDRWKLQLHWD